MSDKLFNENNKEKKQKNKLFVYLVALYIKFNSVLTWIVLLINSVFIAYMIKEMNIGIVFFLANEYLILVYYMRFRKDKKNKEKKRFE